MPSAGTLERRSEMDPRSRSFVSWAARGGGQSHKYVKIRLD